MEEDQFRELMECLRDIAERLGAVEEAVASVESAVSSVETAVFDPCVYDLEDVVKAVREIEEAVPDDLARNHSPRSRIRI
jgi:hypothetical protein